MKKQIIEKIKEMNGDSPEITVTDIKYKNSNRVLKELEERIETLLPEECKFLIQDYSNLIAKQRNAFAGECYRRGIEHSIEAIKQLK